MAAAVLTRYFSEINVVSAGIAGVEGQRIPESILNLADTWNLNVQDTVSHSLHEVKDHLLASDFVVVAEDQFITYIVDFGVPVQKILSMQDTRFDHNFIPFDPIGYGQKVVSIEIAKAIMTTIQLLKTELGAGHKNKVEAIFPLNEGDFQIKLERAWQEAREVGGIVMLSDFRAPNFSAASKVCDQLLELRVSRVDQSITFAEGTIEDALNQVPYGRAFGISARFEMDHVEKFVLSKQFIGLVDRLASLRPIFILTEPMGMGSCPYLVAASASL